MLRRFVACLITPTPCELRLTISGSRLQDVKSAAEFYEGKIKDLSSNITDLETIVQNKSNTLRAVEEGESCHLSLSSLLCDTLTACRSAQTKDSRATKAASSMSLAHQDISTKRPLEKEKAWMPRLLRHSTSTDLRRNASL